MPGVDGIEATRRIIAEASCDKIVMLTSFIDRDRILRRGRRRSQRLPAEGRRAGRAHPRHPGRGPRRCSARSAAASALLRAPSPQAVDDLTPASARCSPSWPTGCPNKLIARRLGIAEKTVKAHLTSAFARIGATDRTQAALWAQRHGLADGASTS